MASKSIDNAFTAKTLRGAATDPTYAGVLSFMRRKHSKDLTDVDAAVLGTCNLQMRAAHVICGSLGSCGCHQALPPNASVATLKMPNAPPPIVARLSAEIAANLLPAS